MDTSSIVILDFGAQYSQLIARRTRELGVYCEIVPYDIAWSKLASRDPVAIILSGGPESTLVDGAPDLDPRLIANWDARGGYLKPAEVSVMIGQKARRRPIDRKRHSRPARATRSARRGLV